MTSSQCSERRGESVGTCASGFGTCCCFIYKPDSTLMTYSLTEKVSYLQNPSFPEAADNSVVQMIRLIRTNKNIHQIRLDFLDFRMDGGTAIDKPCNRDKFIIGGKGGKILKVGALCGNNKGQHLYIPAEKSEKEVATIRLEIGGLVNDRSRWNIRVTQVTLSLTILEISCILL